mmetsp:Transcript_9495/g.17804  ORF Transcript_9495/g.17804 Transcript_9495/m.17804 type:complete len:400 (-) Transcript_9495:685-1884(-)
MDFEQKSRVEAILCDGTIIKKIDKTGREEPQASEGDQVLMSAVFSSDDGTELLRQEEVEITVDSDDAHNAALHVLAKHMQPGETCTATLLAPYTLAGHVSTRVQVELKQVYQVVVVVPGGVSLRARKDGALRFARSHAPRDTDQVHVKLWEVVNGVPGPCEPLKFTMGDGTAMEGLEKVLEELPMDYCVRATLQGEYTLPDIPAEVPEDEDLASTILVMDVELVDIVRGEGDKVSMKGPVKLKRGAELKEMGAQLFAAKRYRRAEEIWTRGAQLFNVLEAEDQFNPSTRSVNEACNAAQIPLLLNTCLCKLKRGAWQEARDDCTEVLDLDPKHVKALFRRGSALIELEEWKEAEADLKQAQRLDPKLRKEVGEKLKYLASRIKAQDQKDMAEIGVHNYP